MSSSNVGATAERREGVASRVIRFGIAGGVALALAGAIEGSLAFYIFRATEQAPFPRYGVVVMTAISSRLPIVLGVVGVLIGGIGMAYFGGGRRAQDNAKAMLATLMRNTLIGTGIGVLVGGVGALAIGRSQSQEPITLFATFFAGVLFGFLLGLIISLVVSAKRKPAAVDRELSRGPE